jgi:predicted secreted hydrolase
MIGSIALAGRAGEVNRLAVRYPDVEPGVALNFPRDFGAHPDYRIEWWYVTGWLASASAPSRAAPDATDGMRPFGVQITFFRVRTAHAPDNPSRFAPRQLLFAHAALALPERRRLLVDQRSARLGPGRVRMDENELSLAVDDWTLRRDPQDLYRARVSIGEHVLALDMHPAGPPLPQGESGYSRKGEKAGQASYYYSRPQLRLSGVLQGPRGGAVVGLGWFDHEWASRMLDPGARGWDWVGLNFDDGTALMAFRIRSLDGQDLVRHARWAHQTGQTGAPPSFEPLRTWVSPRSGNGYPVSMAITIGERRLELVPLFDDQELDTRASTGTLYWEGAVVVREASRDVGRGYLELTGYGAPLRV